MPDGSGEGFATVERTESSETTLCAKCGTALAGAFCGTCGAPSNAATAGGREGWSAITNELLSRPDRNGVFAVALSFLRYPVSTIIRLTNDPSYRSHWSFLTACVGAQLTLVYVLLPRLFSTLFNIPDTSNGAAVITNEFVQYVGMAILTPVQFYICRALGSVPRSPMSYVKLCVLSVSFCALLSIVVAVSFFLTAVVTLKANLPLNLTAIWQAMSIVTLGGVIAFVAASHRIFWGMTWVIATSVTVVFAALSWLVVYPALAAAADKANIAGTLGHLFG